MKILIILSVIHLFPWSGILDENYELSETFQVPDIKTGNMVKLMTQLTQKEEEMFRNMIRRLNNIVSVRLLSRLFIFFFVKQAWTSSMMHVYSYSLPGGEKIGRSHNGGRRANILSASHLETDVGNDAQVQYGEGNRYVDTSIVFTCLSLQSLSGEEVLRGCTWSILS